MSFILVGLGNPGEEYAETRHNAGRMIVSTITKAFDGDDFKYDKKTNALISKIEIEHEKVLCVLPETFMNHSGASLKSLVTSVKKAEKVVVFYDDLDLPLGTMKMSFNRSSGGHRGVESIIKTLKTEAFVRIRIGIAPVTPSGKIRKPKGEDSVQKHIMGQFKKAEQDILKKQTRAIIEVLPVLMKEGLNKAMTLCNA